MEIDIEMLFKLMNNAASEAKEKSSYYEGFIKGIHEAQSMVQYSRTDKHGNCEEDKTDDQSND